MNFIKITIPGIPASKGSFNQGRYGQIYPADKKLKGWVNAISWQARAQAPRQPSQAAIDMTITFNLPHSANNTHTQPIIKPDLDKLTRAVMDALTGIIYEDDSQVIRLECNKTWAIDAPGCEIEIREANTWEKIITLAEKYNFGVDKAAYQAEIFKEAGF